jgi:hypothetical protein
MSIPPFWSLTSLSLSLCLCLVCLSPCICVFGCGVSGGRGKKTWPSCFQKVAKNTEAEAMLLPASTALTALSRYLSSFYLRPSPTHNPPERDTHPPKVASITQSLLRALALFLVFSLTHTHTLSLARYNTICFGKGEVRAILDEEL